MAGSPRGGDTSHIPGEPVRRINYRALRDAVLATAAEVVTRLKPSLMLRRDYHSLDRTKKDRADQTRRIDVEAHERYLESLQRRLPGTDALLCSEENPLGTSLTNASDLPDLLFIVDPIDNTDGAIHGSPAYTALSVYLRSASTVIAAAVGDFCQGELYYADEECSAFKVPVSDTAADKRVQIRASDRTDLAGAYLALYTLKPTRLLRTGRATALLNKLGDEGRVDCIGGAAALCKVAAGYIDGAVEFVKGFQAYDLFPGAYILMKAGGLCCRPDTGDSVSLSLKFSTQDELPTVLKTRQPFIAAGTQPLYNKILAALAKNRLLARR
jgi:myo-inositol-1(or 4)-monophosphatase